NDARLFLAMIKPELREENDPRAYKMAEEAFRNSGFGDLAENIGYEAKESELRYDLQTRGILHAFPLLMSKFFLGFGYTPWRPAFFLGIAFILAGTSLVMIFVVPGGNVPSFDKLGGGRIKKVNLRT